MNLDKIEWVIYLKKSNKMGKECNVSIKIKYLSLLKKKLFEKKIFCHFSLIKRNLKPSNFFLSEKPI